MRKWSILFLPAVAALSLAGCNRAELLGETEVRGKVTDIQGEAVPGVVVSVLEPFKQCLTTGLGQYDLVVDSGRIELHFMKTGYTSGTLVIADAEPGTVAARPVSLWRLPQMTGVFLFEDYTYRRGAPLKPKAYVGEDGRVVYGVGKLTGVVETRAAKPLLLCHKMPWYDAKLCLLGTIKAAAPESPSVKEEVWVSEKTLPLAMAPLDEPDRLLWEVRLMEQLAPGIYAIHWGALEGYTSTDPRIFAFAVAQASGESSLPPGAGEEPLAAPEEDEAAAEPEDGETIVDDEAPDEAPDAEAE